MIQNPRQAVTGKRSKQRPGGGHNNGIRLDNDMGQEALLSCPPAESTVPSGDSAQNSQERLHVGKKTIGALLPRK